ncbi:MAG: ABC transporter ATP-binding protein [Candidatus Bathyarchaeia archaeon]
MLEVEGLSVSYLTREGEVKALEEVSLSVGEGESVALVGESGCGKSTLAYTVMRLLPSNAVVKVGSVKLDGVDVLNIAEEEFRSKFRWKKVAYIPQGSFNALNPVLKISDQIAETILTHEHLVAEEAHLKAKGLLKLVEIPEALADAYPHQLSGGMRQRTVMAMALTCHPRLLIADEPTTALDVVVQAQVMSVLKSMAKNLKLSLMLITHDIALAASTCEKITVMYAGNIVETQPTEDFVKKPLHPYSRLLMDTIPHIHGPKRRLTTIPGDPPDMRNPPQGCRFHPRCPWVQSECQRVKPPLNTLGKRAQVACHHPLSRGDKQRRS